MFMPPGATGPSPVPSSSLASSGRYVVATGRGEPDGRRPPAPGSAYPSSRGPELNGHKSSSSSPMVPVLPPPKKQRGVHVEQPRSSAPSFPASAASAAPPAPAFAFSAPRQDVPTSSNNSNGNSNASNGGKTFATKTANATVASPLSPKLSSAAEESIAKRRGELRRLQRLKYAAVGTPPRRTTNSTEDLLARARSHLTPPVSTEGKPSSAAKVATHVPPPPLDVPETKPTLTVSEKKPTVTPQKSVAEDSNETPDSVLKRADMALRQQGKKPAKAAPPSPVTTPTSTPPQQPGPDAAAPTNGGSSSSSLGVDKRELLRQMRQGAETPNKQDEEKKEDIPQPSKSEPSSDQSQSDSSAVSTKLSKEDQVLRLVRELKKTTNERAEAMIKISRLEAELQLRTADAPTSPFSSRSSVPRSSTLFRSVDDLDDGPDPLDQLMDIVEREGEAAGIRWAMDQVDDRRTSNRSQRNLKSKTKASSSQSSSAQSPPRSLALFPPILTSSARSSPRLGVSLATSALVTSSAGADSLLPSRRVKTPIPKRRFVHSAEKSNFSPYSKPHGLSVPDEADEGVDPKYLTEASRTVPEEYSSNLAKYYVRRPHLPSSEDRTAYDAESRARWRHATSSILSDDDEYDALASADSASSIHVMAQIEADDSTLVLQDSSTMYHANRDGQWMPTDGSGSVGYIDVDGSEKEYMLDVICEEAVAVREAYCAALLSAASALQMSAAKATSQTPAKKTTTSTGFPQTTRPEVGYPPVAPQSEAPPIDMAPPPAAVPPPGSVVPPPATAVPPPSTAVPPALVTEQGKRPPMEKGEKKKPKVSIAVPEKESKPQETNTPEPSGEEQEMASDVLSLLLIRIFSFVFSVLWFLLVKLPLRIGFYAVVAFVCAVAVKLTTLYLAHDGGAMEMGAHIAWDSYNPVGIH